MPALTVTARGQVTLRKDTLKHLGIQPGDKVQVELLPGGQVTLKAEKPSKGWDSFFGLLAGKTDKVATLEEIEETIQKGWAGEL